MYEPLALKSLRFSLTAEPFDRFVSGGKRNVDLLYDFLDPCSSCFFYCHVNTYR